MGLGPRAAGVNGGNAERSPRGRGSPPGGQLRPRHLLLQPLGSQHMKGLCREQGAPVQAEPTAAVPEPASRSRLGGFPGAGGAAWLTAVRPAGPRLSWGRFGRAAVGAPVVLVRMRIPGPRPATRLGSSGDGTLNKPLCSHHPHLTGREVGKRCLRQELVVEVMRF